MLRIDMRPLVTLEIKHFNKVNSGQYGYPFLLEASHEKTSLKKSFPCDMPKSALTK